MCVFLLLHAPADAPFKESYMEEEQQALPQALQIGVWCAWAAIIGLRSLRLSSQHVHLFCF